MSGIMHCVLAVSKTTGTQLVLSSSTANYNLFTAAGSPAGAVNLTLTINSGVTVYSSSTGTAALIASGFAVGSVITIINNGDIQGAGGALGAGGYSAPGAPGGAGGDAIACGSTATYFIDNTSGNIYGGGGGGGGGGGAYQNFYDGKGAYVSTSYYSGGNGGNGQGYGQSQTNGSAGTAAVNGVTGAGGNGGTWGVAGATGGTSTVSTNGNGVNYAGGAGGAAGFAIRKNSASVTITGGNNGTQIKGSVA